MFDPNSTVSTAALSAVVEAVGNLAVDDPVLAKYAAEIRRLGKRVKEDVVAIGRYLDQAQKHAGHGTWLAWIQTEFSWSDQTAYRFIHLYQAQQNPEFHNLWNSNLPVSALSQLAAPNTPQEARDEVAARVEAGERPSCAMVTEAIAQAKGAAKTDTAAADVQDNQDDEDPSVEQRRAEHAALFAEPADLAGSESTDEVHGRENLTNGSGSSAAELLLKVWDATTPEDQQFIRDLVLAEFFARAGGADIFDRIPAIRRAGVARGFLDQLTAQGMCEAMSPEFRAQLHARMPAPKRKSDKPFKKGLNHPTNSTRNRRGHGFRH
jgi:hypothetical protein